jgi:phenylalanyl-tRNA synthetase beta chain
MIVSWNWLRDYVDLDVDAAELQRRLMMAGLNHEATIPRGDDLAIDLEVTSNRPDCLGHLGVAREAAVLCARPLRVPAAEPPGAGPDVRQLARVRIECPALCDRYTARVIRNVRVGPSPAWLVSRLQTIGVAVINNVVDVTNYVLFECGQPLHAFDLRLLAGPEIIVREARQGEEFTAIDHRVYRLEPGMCVIADARQAVALGGVMGGAGTEVSRATTDLLIESAEFAPVSIRTTARKLNLHSAASYRFERRVDPEGIDWASRRCCELILDLAGGELAHGVIDVGREVPRRAPIRLRLDQFARILGIDVADDEVARILTALGIRIEERTRQQMTVIAPSWRRDLTREIDLVEEVARIHGYERIPEDAAVPMWPCHRGDWERVLEVVRRALVAAGFDEAVTASIVPQEWSVGCSPWTTASPIVSATPMKGILSDAPRDLSQADTMRRSLLPSLLEARRYNEAVSNPNASFFEIAKVYLPQAGGLPEEPWMLAIVGGDGFLRLKGALESLLLALHSPMPWQVLPTDLPLLDQNQSCALRLDQSVCGFCGMLAPEAQQRYGLRAATVVAELRLDALLKSARLIPQYVPLSPYPTTSRDLNLIVDESLRWAELAATIQSAGGEYLESLVFQEIYRDPQKDGAGKKRMLFSFTLRAPDRTLTSEEADGIRDAIVVACRRQHSARLLV